LLATKNFSNMSSGKNGDIIDKIQDYKIFLKSFRSFRFLTFRDLFRDTAKLFLTVVFFPVLIILSLFENRIFTRIVRQVLIFLYFIFTLIFFYSLFTYDSYLNSYRAISVDVPFLDKIKDIK
jgi:hypothetical protein